MSGDKSEKISISLPARLLEAVDLAMAPGQSRSGYFQAIAERDLRLRGKYEVDPIEAEQARLRELIATRGLEVVHAKLDELVVETTAAVA